MNNPADLIRESIHNNRTVFAHCETQQEYEELLNDLLASSDADVDTADIGTLSRTESMTEVWSEDGWRIHLIHPAY